MPGLLEGKVCVVTGAASGIGRSTAIAMAHEGARVVVADALEDELAQTVELATKEGGMARPRHTDVRNEESVAGLMAFTIEQFGRLDCAFNNAGIEGDHFKPLAEYSVSTWSNVIAVNLTGVFLCMKHQLPHLVVSKGCIVNTASVAGLSGGTLGSAYFASKHGVVGLTRAAAMEYARLGVRVNAVAPGVIRTPMAERAFLQNPDIASRVTALHPMGRLGDPNEVARAVVWLCSENASFTTGHVLPVDGGFLVP
jgi:NAD(P)-dependent dehydrogenase (short-subunit alcohol dehydrogenase family)